MAREPAPRRRLLICPLSGVRRDDRFAAVAAEDHLTARRALDRIKVVYEPLPAVFDPEEALRPDAPVVISFSNRCFPTKAVAVWRNVGPQSHARLIDLYLRAAGFAEVEMRPLLDGRRSDPMTVVVGRTRLDRHPPLAPL